MEENASLLWGYRTIVVSKLFRQSPEILEGVPVVSGRLDQKSEFATPLSRTGLGGRLKLVSAMQALCGYSEGLASQAQELAATLLCIAC